MVSRNSIRDVPMTMKILEHAYSENGNLISPYSISKHLGISDKTADNHLRMLEESLMIMRVAVRYDWKKILKRTCKYYAADMGMKNAFVRTGDGDIGRLAENAVFLELRRRGYRVAVGKFGDSEIDFTDDRNGVTEYLSGRKYRHRRNGPGEGADAARKDGRQLHEDRDHNGCSAAA